MTPQTGATPPLDRVANGSDVGPARPCVRVAPAVPPSRSESGSVAVPLGGGYVRDLRDLRRRLYEARLAAGLSQDQLAEQIGCVQSAVSEWETGAIIPTLRNAAIWARALGLELTLRPIGGAR